MQKLYYVGPKDIFEASLEQPEGQPICQPGDVGLWIQEHVIKPDRRGYCPATYVVDLDGWLRLAHRRSEHVACAGGEAVLAAGEIFFGWDDETDGELYVADISNQSTGYCPPLSSWGAVARALERVPIAHPDEWISPFVFRLCPACLQRNLVKDQWFVCATCGVDLPDSWNFATAD